jgi:hypothetical protein
LGQAVDHSSTIGLDDLSRARLAELNPHAAAVAAVLADWWQKRPPGTHAVGLFLELLGEAGYRVVKRP